FLCLECGDIQDIFIDELFDVAKVVENQENVQVQSFDMSFKGICSKCKGHKVN
ncbi:transcriptional repressor, partial [Turicibacter sanguinis]|nr:transcriptional repressor [Turicibacter sanguinis]